MFSKETVRPIEEGGCTPVSHVSGAPSHVSPVPRLWAGPPGNLLKCKPGSSSNSSSHTRSQNEMNLGPRRGAGQHDSLPLHEGQQETQLPGPAVQLWAGSGSLFLPCTFPQWQHWGLKIGWPPHSIQSMNREGAGALDPVPLLQTLRWAESVKPGPLTERSSWSSQGLSLCPCQQLLLLVSRS